MVMILGDGAFGRGLGQEGKDITKEISALVKESQQSLRRALTRPSLPL